MAKLNKEYAIKKLLEYDTLRSRGLNQKQACEQIGHRANVVWRWQKALQKTQNHGLPAGQVNGDF